MKKSKKDKKGMILHLILCVVVILIAISYFPVKIAVYADKDDERRHSKLGVLEWYDKQIDDSGCIVETSGLIDRPKLKKSGVNYKGGRDASKIPVYYEVRVFDDPEFIVQGKSPLLELNSNFDPCKVKNYFAIRYFDLYWIENEQGEMKEGYYVLPIVIKDWTPVYPIQRSGTLASILLPKGYLTIWDFIG